MKYDLEELINETYKNKQEPPEQLNISVLKKMEEHVMKKKQNKTKHVSMKKGRSGLATDSPKRPGLEESRVPLREAVH